MHQLTARNISLRGTVVLKLALTLVFGPDWITRRVVMDAREVRKRVERVGDGNTELVRELPRCGPSYSYRPHQLSEPQSTATRPRSPICPASSRSCAMVRGCEQQVLVHMPGKVIFSSARFCSSSFPVTGWNMKTENARCRGDLVSLEPGGGMRWPGGHEGQYPVGSARREFDVQSFLDPSPMASSSCERRMRRSSMSSICSALYCSALRLIVYAGVDIGERDWRGTRDGK
jgi:hypothetical protein